MSVTDAPSILHNTGEQIVRSTDDFWEAVIEGDVAQVWKPIHSGQDVNKMHYDEPLTALLAAVMKSHLEVQCAPCSKHNAIHNAATHGHVKLCESLLAERADASARMKDGMPPLHGAAMDNYADVCVALLAAGADVHAICEDSRGENGPCVTPLYLTANVYLEVCLALVAASACVDSEVEGDIPLLGAIVLHHRAVCLFSWQPGQTREQRP